MKLKLSFQSKSGARKYVAVRPYAVLVWKVPNGWEFNALRSATRLPQYLQTSPPSLSPRNVHYLSLPRTYTFYFLGLAMWLWNRKRREKKNNHWRSDHIFKNSLPVAENFVKLINISKGFMWAFWHVHVYKYTNFTCRVRRISVCIGHRKFDSSGEFWHGHSVRCG